MILGRIQRNGNFDVASTDLCAVGVRVKFRSLGPTTYEPAGIPGAEIPTWNMP